MKDRFKAVDWERLRRLPIMMFQFVSLADRELQPEEAEAFTAELQDARAYKDPLHRALFTDLFDGPTFSKAFEAVVGITSSSVKAIEKEFKATKKVLKKELTTEEYHRFFVSLTGTGMKVAGAVGEGVHSVSPEEVAAIVVFLSKFDVDVDAGKRALARL